MKIQSPIQSALLFSATAIVLLAGGLAHAQEVEEIDVARDDSELRVELRTAIDRDTDVANTALVFNNVTSSATHVHCVAWDGNGNRLSRKTARIPARGVKYLRASDLSDGVDFVGSAVCTSRSRIAASAVFLAPGAMTNLEVIQSDPWHATRIRFPLIASY